MDGWIVLKEVGGWSAFLSLALLVVVSFLKGWVYPGPIVDKFQKAWETERDARAQMEDKKHPAVMAALEANQASLEGLRTALREQGRTGERESQ